MFCGTATVPLFAFTFAIDRVGCRFCVRNALHSFRRLLTPASDAAPVVRATYFRTSVRCLLIKLFCGHGNHSAFCARLRHWPRKMPLSCAECAEFIAADSHARTQAMLIPPSELHIFVQLYVVFQIILRLGNRSAFCARLRH